MWTVKDLFLNFFTHKDFLPPADQLPGTLFTPLHLAVAAVFVAAVVILGLWTAKRSEKVLRRVLACLWVLMIIAEPTKIVWETLCGRTVAFNWTGVLPLYPCSIFMYAMPFAIWGSGYVRKAACGYVCSLGLLGGVINFVYPVNVLGTYSCLSFAGMHTLVYHSVIVFCALTMLVSGYHSYTWVKKGWQLLVPAVPFLIMSVPANLVNFSRIDSDYMFFKLESFFFAPIGHATPDWFSVVLVYGIYLLIHALPYIPGWLAARKLQKAESAS